METFAQEMGKVFVKAAVAAAGATLGYLVIDGTSSLIMNAFKKSPMPTQAEAQHATPPPAAAPAKA